jgi:hypothetical protein
MRLTPLTNVTDDLPDQALKRARHAVLRTPQTRTKGGTVMDTVLPFAF